MTHEPGARRAALILAVCLSAAPVVAADPSARTAGAEATSRPAADSVDRLLHDYIALYTKDTLDQWRTLFHPGFVAAFTNDDGSTTSRTLEEFLQRQRNYFATGRPISEELKDVRIERQGALASVRAGFILHDGDTAKEGRLMLLLIRERDRWLVQSLVFSYHLEPTK